MLLYVGKLLGALTGMVFLEQLQQAPYSTPTRKVGGESKKSNSSNPSTPTPITVHTLTSPL
jgi:hypothetical protein